METIEKKILEKSQELSQDTEALQDDKILEGTAESGEEREVGERKERRLVRVRRFLAARAKKAPAWAKYLFAHKGQLFLTLLVSLVVTAAFVFQKYLSLAVKFEEDFSSPIELLKTAAWVKADG